MIGWILLTATVAGSVVFIISLFRTSYDVKDEKNEEYERWRGI